MGNLCAEFTLIFFSRDFASTEKARHVSSFRLYEDFPHHTQISSNGQVLG
jgi:hypothetical protein